MLKNNIIYSTTTSEIKLIRKEPNREIAPGVEIAIFTLCLALTIAGIFLLLTSPVWKQKKKIATTQSLSQIPCRNCQFFKENQYLKCAVHPTIVLTQQALNCRDYQQCE